MLALQEWIYYQEIRSEVLKDDKQENYLISQLNRIEKY